MWQVADYSPVHGPRAPPPCLRWRSWPGAAPGHLMGRRAHDRAPAPHQFASAHAGARAAAVAFFALPFLGLLWRAPWSDAWDHLTASDACTALRLSIVCSLWATGLSLVFGVPLAWVLARVEFRGRGAVRALCTLSMVLPPVVGGVALFFALGRRGLVGQYLDRWFDIPLPFTTRGVVLAQTFVAMPFLVITVEAALRQLDRRYEDAARTLGASRWYAFRRVTMPAVRPGARRRRGARLGAGARRVRRHDHLRRQLPRHDADHAARHLPRARVEPARGDRPQPRADRGVVRRAARPARPVAGRARARRASRR